jgi:hypothetical protein
MSNINNPPSYVRSYPTLNGVNFGTFLCTGAITAESTLAVTGASTLTGAVAASSTLDVTGATTLTSLTTTGNVVFSGATSTFLVSGASSVVTLGSATTSSVITVGSFQARHWKTSTITIATVLPASASGFTYFLGANAGAIAVTLPSPSDVGAGGWFEFIVGVNGLTGAVTISSDTTNVHIVTSGPDIGTGNYISSANTARTSVIFGTGSDIGDRVHLISDGTLYYAKALVAVAANLTVA